MIRLFFSLAISALSIQQAELPVLQSKPLPVRLAQITPAIEKPYNWLATKRAKLWLAFPDDLAKSLRFETYEDLDQAFARGEAVEVFNFPEILGVRLRTTGKSPIGEFEPKPSNKQKLLRLRPEAAGLLYLLAEKVAARVTAFQPFPMTSLVRPGVYNKKVVKRNANADLSKSGLPPTHIFGLAFDIGRKELGSLEDAAIESVLREMEALGKVIYFKEGKCQAAYHVIALPNSSQEFRQSYQRVAYQIYSLKSVASSHAR
ncbi:MAG: hypothetical protein ACM3KM_04435 [Acidobacteriaceae bacterium]